MVTSIKASEPSYGIPCAVCGTFIHITQSEARYTTFRLCDECIKAIKFARALMKNNPNMNIDEGEKELWFSDSRQYVATSLDKKETK